MTRKPSSARRSPIEPATKSDLISLVDQVFATRLPRDWSFETEIQPVIGGSLRPDMIVTVTAPDGSSTRLVVEVKRSLGAVQSRAVSDRLGRYLSALTAEGVNACSAVVAPYVSAANRERLSERGIGFVDATGNVRLVCDQPALFIESRGADRDPWSAPSKLQSLKGTAAGAAVRALVDFLPPYGIRELADRAGVSAPTLSRVVGLLDREALVERKPRGPVQSLHWEGAIRRWALDYSVIETNRVATFLGPRGLEDVGKRLGDTRDRYAVTGSMALPDDVSIAPVRLAMVYTRDVAGLASNLDLRMADAGTNVLMIEPYDDVVFARTGDRRGLVAVAYSQLAADLLTGPGRSPTEGEELLMWMKDNEGAWRTRA